MNNSAKELLLASWLIAIDRGPDKAPRPIAGGSALLKLAGQCVLAVGSSHVRTLFEVSGVQFGIAIPDGVPTVTRLTQLMLEADEKHIALATDIRNGYGTTPRSEMLRQLFSHRSLSCFWRMMGCTLSPRCLCFATPQELLWQCSSQLKAFVRETSSLA